MDYKVMGRNGSPYREFPLLAPVFPAGPSELKKLRRDWPLLRGELIRSWVYHRAVVNAPEGEQREVFVYFFSDTYHLPSNLPRVELYGKYADAVDQAGKFIRDLVSTYFVESFREQFSSEGVVEATNDPIELLKHCFSAVREHDAIGRMRAFEARRKLVLGQLLLNISQSQGREEALNYDKWFITRHLEQTFFTERSEKRTVWSVHDPARDFETVEILGERTSLPGVKVIETTLTVRYFRSFGEEIPVFFEPGVKLPFSHLEKMIREGVRDPDMIKDLRRYALVFENEYHLRRGLRVLRERTHRAPGVVHDHSSNLWGDGPADDSNRHSHPNYRQKKWLVDVDGREFEGMVQVLPEFLDGKYAQNGKNHALYKLEQRVDSTFPMLFPTEIYGINWKDPRVVQKLRNKIIAESQ